MQFHSSNAAIIPDVSNNKCIPDGAERTSEYKKMTVVNNFDKKQLKELLVEKSIIPDDNPFFNQFIHCVWKNEGLFYNNDIQYNKLESLIKNGIVSVVGTSGPAINLSILHAKRVIDECRSVTGVTPGNKIMRVQNCILGKLQPFSTI